jgi:hypothetical protein
MFFTGLDDINCDGLGGWSVTSPPTSVVLKGFSVANFAVKDALTEDEARLGFRALIKDGLACPSMVSLMGGISTMNNANKEVNVHE